MAQNSADIKAKIELMRKQKEEREKARKQREQEAAAERGKPAQTSAMVDVILHSSEQEFSNKVTGAISHDTEESKQQPSGVQMVPARPRPILKVYPLIVEIEIVAKVKPETYTREVQCDILDPATMGNNKNSDDDSQSSDEFSHRLAQAADRKTRGTLRRDSKIVRRNSINEPGSALFRQQILAQKAAPEPPKEITKDEAKKIMSTNEFQSFLENSSRFVERALGAEFDIKGNFFEASDSDEEEDDKHNRQRSGKVMEKFTFEPENAYDRSVTSLDWHPTKNELILASYSESQQWGLDEPDGLITIYSLAMQTRPELTLNCQYEVTKAVFNPFDPNTVIGATQTGYLLLWDLRAKKDPVNTNSNAANDIWKDVSRPVQKSCTANSGHSHPVYCLNVVGSKNAHSIVSVCNAGKLCQWKTQSLLDSHDDFLLDLPTHLREQISKAQQERIAAISAASGNAPSASASSVAAAASAGPSAITGSSQTKNNIFAHCMQFPEGESDKFFVGAEDFNIYQCNLHSASSSNPSSTPSSSALRPGTGGEKHMDKCFIGHNAAITSISTHPGASQNDQYPEMSDLILSSSLDWTVKLWSPKTIVEANNNVHGKALMTFESSQEYKYDVAWSPKHPAIFASCDAEGILDVWDINKDKEAPQKRVKVRGDDAQPLNCLKFAPTGERMVVGDAKGKITLMGLENDMVQATQDDYERIIELVGKQ